MAENNGDFNCQSEFLFESALLKRLNWNDHRASFRPGISPSNPGEHLIMRPLSVSDFDRGTIFLIKCNF